MFGILKWLKQKLRRRKPEPVKIGCEHHFRKHWSRRAGPFGAYVRRCTKCGKVA